MTGLPTLTEPQPPASLVAERVKRIIDRSWAAPANLIGQHIGIHAGAKVPDVERVGHWTIANFASGWHMAPSVYFREQDQPADHPGHFEPRPLPLGAIVATARLTACLLMVEMADDVPDAPELIEVLPDGRLMHWPEGAQLDVEVEDWSDQAPYGQFEPGRYAWLLDDIKPTSARCPWCIPPAIANSRCPSSLFHGPGHQSEAPCQLTEPHHVHTAHLMGTTAEWTSAQEQTAHGRDHTIFSGVFNEYPEPECPVCDGAGSCEPVRAKGKQRVWPWTPDVFGEGE